MRRLLLPAAVCAVAVTVVAVVNAGGKSTVTLRFDEKSTLFKVIDNPPTDAGQAPESGDIVLFASDLTSGGRKVGTNRGFCTVAVVSVALPDSVSTDPKLTGGTLQLQLCAITAAGAAASPNAMNAYRSNVVASAIIGR